MRTPSKAQTFIAEGLPWSYSWRQLGVNSAHDTSTRTATGKKRGAEDAIEAPEAKRHADEESPIAEGVRKGRQPKKRMKK